MKIKREIECPGCGKRAIVELTEGTRKKDFDCPQCKTIFTITFETDDEENRLSFILAKDIPG